MKNAVYEQIRARKSRRPHKIRFRIPPEIISLILRIRKERRYGAVRVSLYLQRHYQWFKKQTRDQHEL